MEPDWHEFAYFASYNLSTRSDAGGSIDIPWADLGAIAASADSLEVRNYGTKLETLNMISLLREAHRRKQTLRNRCSQLLEDPEVFFVQEAVQADSFDLVFMRATGDTIDLKAIGIVRGNSSSEMLENGSLRVRRRVYVAFRNAHGAEWLLNPDASPDEARKWRSVGDLEFDPSLTQPPIEKDDLQEGGTFGQFMSSQPFTRVYLDGRRLGTTPLPRVAVLEGEHWIEWYDEQGNMLCPARRLRFEPEDTTCYRCFFGTVTKC